MSCGGKVKGCSEKAMAEGINPIFFDGFQSFKVGRFFDNNKNRGKATAFDMKDGTGVIEFDDIEVSPAKSYGIYDGEKSLSLTAVKYETDDGEVLFSRDSINADIKGPELTIYGQNIPLDELSNIDNILSRFPSVNQDLLRKVLTAVRTRDRLDFDLTGFLNSTIPQLNYFDIGEYFPKNDFFNIKPDFNKNNLESYSDKRYDLTPKGFIKNRDYLTKDELLKEMDDDKVFHPYIPYNTIQIPSPETIYPDKVPPGRHFDYKLYEQVNPIIQVMATKATKDISYTDLAPIADLVFYHKTLSPETIDKMPPEIGGLFRTERMVNGRIQIHQETAMAFLNAVSVKFYDEIQNFVLKKKNNGQK